MGYVLAVALGFFLFLRRSAPSPVAWWFGATALFVGLLSPLSRGPAVGGLAIVLAFIATGRSTISGLTRFAFLSLVAFSILMATPASENIIEYLSIFGSVDTENITYRVKLLMLSLDVMAENILFGAYDFYLKVELQDLKQGQGIIDIVNTYVGIGLASGAVGLSLFAGFFIAVATGVSKGMKNMTDSDDELFLLGRALLATLAGILVMIFMVSNLMTVPLIYWSVGGLCVAYVRMLALAKAPEAARPAGLQPATV